MPDPPANPQTPLLRIDDLAVSFPGKGPGGRLQAVDRVAMSIFPGQTLAVVGESGSGKSVSALSVLQLVPVPPGRYDRGRILWHSDEIAGQPQDLLTRSDKQMRKIRGNQIAMIFQEPMTSLNPVYTIGDQILEAILLHQPVQREQALAIAERALRDVGIADPASRLGEYPHQLSGGMRQRVMIAMALACEPRLLLADEPTTALDVTIQAQILELLRHLQQTRGMAIMLITHDLGVVAENADVVAVMYAGRICEYGKVEDIFQDPLHPYTRGLLLSMPVLGRKVDRLPTVMDGAKAPDDFPDAFTVAPHVEDPNPAEGYGGPDARLYEVRPGRWVLCTPRDGVDTAEQRTPPVLDYRRAAMASTT